ncbi:thioredoxin family protein [Sedimentibacter sp.]|uniref:glutaredoxin family protein n=1 Tax=Sedimentibacter sp. TaxID=1960295 RepID=UPI00289818D4|nr:thioredoxin family protein [Sedimentibacter sp.]
MKKIKAFYLQNCPHCKRAFKVLEELKSQNSSYSEIDIEYIEESENVQAASAHDYYYVPTFYVDGVKIHEGVPTLEKLEEVLKKAL